jgi:hypothetical protein
MSGNLFPTEKAAITALQGEVDSLEVSKQSINEKASADGYASLDSSAKIPINQIPDAILGALKFKGTWDATTGIITSSDLALNGQTPPAASPANEGFYFITQVAGNYSIGGINSWVVGDWLISLGSEWSKIDNTDSVSSVNGQTGVVGLATSDIPEDIDFRYVTDAQRAVIENTSGENTGDTPSAGTDIQKGDGSGGFANAVGGVDFQEPLTNSMLGDLMSNGASKPTPVDADLIPFLDSTVSFSQVQATWAQIKAWLFSSPTLTGTPVVPTAAVNTNTAQVANTAFVMSEINKSTFQAQPADPTPTTSAAGVMMGLAGSITPSRSGKVMVTISGDMDVAGANNAMRAQIYTGTGAAPANGAALTGTARGSNPQQTNGGGAGIVRTPFSCQSIITGLAIGTPVWLDLAVSSVGGVASARVRNISITAVEV